MNNFQNLLFKIIIYINLHLQIGKLKKLMDILKYLLKIIKYMLFMVIKVYIFIQWKIIH